MASAMAFAVAPSQLSAIVLFTFADSPILLNMSASPTFCHACAD